MWLIIVESPSKCRKIEEYLGFNYKCIATIGHFRAVNSLGSLDNPFFSIMPDKKANVTAMRKTISKYDKSRILLATDDDREGEAIAWHVCDTFKLSPETTHRIKFHEITATAIRDAVASPTTINMDLVRAQQTRQVLDMLVGFKVSPVLWKFIHGGLSAGRCQTPALRLVYDNERQKTETAITMTHKIVGFFHKREFGLSREMSSDETLRQFLEKSADFQHSISSLPAAVGERAPPTPYNTSGLLQSACNSLRMTPKEVMKYCQVLYQDGFITYMRTDSTKYSDEFATKTRDYIKTKYGDKYARDGDAPPPAIAREGLEGIDDVVVRCAFGANRRFPSHEAIRPTNISLSEIPGNDKKLQSLYSLIWKNSLASCMAPKRYASYEFRVSAPENLFYAHVAEVVIEPGWRAVFDAANRATTEPPSFMRGFVSPSQIKSCPAFHGAHSHYTEASLIRKLEELGIGRPSTFASLVEVIQDRKYVVVEDVEGTALQCNEYTMTGTDKNIKVERKSIISGNEKQKLRITPLGITCIEFLISHFSELFSYDYTNAMEARLDAMELAGLCRDCDATIQKSIDGLPSSTCRGDALVDLGENVLLKSGKYGTYVERNGVRKNTRGKTKVSLDDAKELLDADKTTSDKNVLRVLDAEYSVRKGKYGPYVLHRMGEGKPTCHNIRKFRGSFLECDPKTLIDWVKNVGVV